VFPTSQIGNLPNQIPLVLDAPRKLVGFWQSECLDVETFKSQSYLLIDRSEGCDHVTSTAPTEES
jgi:hypothetical protein